MAQSLQRVAPAAPRAHRRERVISSIYVVMAGLVASFLATTFALWALGV
jgi:hypothetical protein